jgi:hypothetical protein
VRARSSGSGELLRPGAVAGERGDGEVAGRAREGLTGEVAGERSCGHACGRKGRGNGRGGGGLQRGPGRGSPEVAACSPVRGRWVNGMVERMGIKMIFFFKIGLTGGPHPHHQIGFFLIQKIAIGLTRGTQCHVSPD